VYLGIGVAYEMKGNAAQAIGNLQQSVKLAVVPIGRMYAVACLAHAYVTAGRKKEAQEQFALLKEMPRSPDRSFQMALIYTGLGEKDQAFEWLGTAYDERSYGMTFIKVEPRMDPLRSDPRYAELLRRMGLPE
jgi:Tfp pilus assembly protein PilF